MTWVDSYKIIFVQMKVKALLKIHAYVSFVKIRFSFFNWMHESKNIRLKSLGATLGSVLTKRASKQASF